MVLGGWLVSVITSRPSRAWAINVLCGFQRTLICPAPCGSTCNCNGKLLPGPATGIEGAAAELGFEGRWLFKTNPVDIPPPAISAPIIRTQRAPPRDFSSTVATKEE